MSPRGTGRSHDGAEIRCLHWGCGPVTPGGWINVDIKEKPGIDISCHILDGLPLDSDSIDYIYSEQDYFWCWDWDTISGNLITQMLDYNYTRTPFTYEFAEELLRKAGFSDVRRVEHHKTTSSHPEIVDLDSWEGDSRKQESFYVEAFK